MGMYGKSIVDWQIPTDITIGGQKFWVYPSSKYCIARNGWLNLANRRQVVFLEIAVQDRKEFAKNPWARPAELGPGGSVEYCNLVITHQEDILPDFRSRAAFEFECAPEHAGYDATTVLYVNGQGWQGLPLTVEYDM